MKNRLLQLLADNRKTSGRVARIVQKAGSREATLYLYDVIVSSQLEAEWYGGVTAQDLVPKIDQLEADVIHLRINSPGGDVFAAQAIAAALQRHNARVVAHIDGLAASAATAIAVVSDEVLMAEGSMFMIHNAWTIAIGDKNDFLDTAALLEKVDGALAAQYSTRSGKALAEIHALMDAETWFTAEEAVAAGFADALDAAQAEPEKEPAAAWNLAALGRPPKAEPQPEKPTAEDLARRARCAALVGLKAA